MQFEVAVSPLDLGYRYGEAWRISSHTIDEPQPKWNFDAFQPPTPVKLVLPIFNLLLPRNNLAEPFAFDSGCDGLHHILAPNRIPILIDNMERGVDLNAGIKALFATVSRKVR